MRREHLISERPRVVLAGRPGAGKGTQGVRLARRLGVQYLSTGDTLRDEIAAGSPLGSAVERMVDAGRLVPTGLIIAIVESNLHGRGFVLDGFPRTLTQAQMLLAHDALAPTVAIEIVVPPRIVIERLDLRRRPDDAAPVARERLSIYETETAEALDWLDRRGLLVRVDGDASPDLVESRIAHALATHARNASTSVGDARVPSAPARTHSYRPIRSL